MSVVDAANFVSALYFQHAEVDESIELLRQVSWQDNLAGQLGLVETWLVMPNDPKGQCQPARSPEERLAHLVHIQRRVPKPELAGTPVKVMLLGVRTTAYAVINAAEHRRREAAGVGAVIDPNLLDRLMDVPVATPVIDSVLWAEMADQGPGILERSEDGTTIIRRLESPLTITDVVVEAAPGDELRAVQDASLFGGFTRRWVATARRRVPDATMLEAKLCGVGILDPGQRAVLQAEKPVNLTVDGWSWQLEEKTYRRWLIRRSDNHAKESLAPATGRASVASEG